MSGVFRSDLFAGKVAFFTGGTSGIGLGIATRFAELGASVILNGRNQEKLDAAVAELRGQARTASGFAADVRAYADLDAAMDQAGEFDFLFCAAAGNFPAPALGMSANGFKAVVDIDLLGTFNACRAAHRHLRKPGASIVAISANHAEVAYSYQAHVCAAKAGVELLMKTLAIEWGPEGIRVNSIRPGPIDETEGMRRLAPNEEIRQMVARSVPLRRFGRKSEIADLAVFLCSDAAAYITGGVYSCDGGMGLAGARGLGEVLGS
jgi:NAD(P)-dependent dehydrogenase (short-subunit alcohol dehydrogenase family)